MFRPKLKKKIEFQCGILRDLSHPPPPPFPQWGLCNSVMVEKCVHLTVIQQPLQPVRMLRSSQDYVNLSCA